MCWTRWFPSSMNGWPAIVRRPQSYQQQDDYTHPGGERLKGGPACDFPCRVDWPKQNGRGVRDAMPLSFRNARGSGVFAVLAGESSLLRNRLSPTQQRLPTPYTAKRYATYCLVLALTRIVR